MRIYRSRSASIEIGDDGILWIQAEWDMLGELRGERRAMTMTSIASMVEDPSEVAPRAFRDPVARDLVKALIRDLRIFTRAVKSEPPAPALVASR